MKNAKQIFLLADVDDNLIDSGREPKVPGAKPVAWDNKGEVCGFLTPKQQVMLDWFRAGCEVVPTTARSTDAMRRFKLPFRRYAITAFGGTVLGANGQPLSKWRQHVEAPAQAAQPVLAELLALVKREASAASIDARCVLLNDYGIDMFLSVKHNSRNLEELSALHAVLVEAVEAGWTVHKNGNFVAVYPPYLGKEKAARWFIDNVVPKGAVTIGMGDSLTDAAFMGECDYVLFPKRTQNSRAFLEGIKAMANGGK
ncbi:MAG: hypothetical protein IT343_15590 [Candidatus Melainabacteria bacterium]|jgi:hypothetical protein|nr:hypothetical protein [Candidatus Melainabacteria bacterium]